MTTADAATLAIAHHEAGHVVAAMLAGVEWTRSQLAPPDHLTLNGATWFSPTGAYTDDPMVRAFLHLAGPIAESRFTGKSLKATINSAAADADREHFEMFRLLNPNVDKDWADLLDQHWGVVERTAVLLASKPTPVTPTDHLPTAEHAEQVLAEHRR